uniref:Uncharacterized protein n=1 Tax=Globodera rostochiensis TaxID=31243 RepID=A0A914GT06_GLORO
MSENASDKEQQQQMDKIFICADVWHGIFAFLSLFDVGLKMALISDRLDVLVDVHFESREWSLGRLYIYRAIGGNGAQIFNFGSGERLPIPQEALPANVTGFEEIEIRYVDQTVIEFLKRICRLFNSSDTNVCITTDSDQSRSWEIIRQKIWPLVNGNICGFHLFESSHFDRLRQISPTVLRNCANLRSINCYDIFPEFPAEDNAAASSAQAVAKWLLTPRGDSLPKMLCYDYRFAKTEGLKGSFVNASKPVNFIIRLRSPSGIEPPFELKNNWTGERLTLRQMDEDNWLLVRCPIGREEDKWAKWETEAIEWDLDDQWNRIDIDFEDSEIGDGMVEAANEGSSKPTD